MQKNIDKLNIEQANAVLMPHESCLVLAGAGSGKTSVLTTRIGTLLSDDPLSDKTSYGLAPESIMAVTFTNKAAKEMKSRLFKMIGALADEIWIGTFHSICLRMIRDNHALAGVDKNFSVIDPDSQESVVRQVIRAMKDNGVEFSEEFEAAHKPSAIIKLFNQAKESGVWDYEQKSNIKFDAESKRRAEVAALPLFGGSAETEDDTQQMDDETLLTEIRALYNKQCREQGYLDFNDLMTVTTKMLRQHESVRDHYRQKFKAILVDEFQDTNDIQYEWLQLISGQKCAVMAVGDDDQSIYSFRGANPVNMQRFIKDFAGKNIVKLEQNYRSKGYILDAANHLISRNQDRLGKNLWSSKDNTPREIDFITYQSAEEEATMIAKKTKQMIADGVPENEIAVLFRTNVQSRILEREFNKMNISHLVYGGFKFYDRVEIKRMLDYIDLVYNLKHDISFTAALSYPPRGIGDKTLADLSMESKQAGISLMQMVVKKSEMPPVGNQAAINKQRKLEEFAGMILDLVEESSMVPLSELAERIAERSGIIKMLKDEGTEEAEERINNINELIVSIKYAEEERNKDLPAPLMAIDFIQEYLGQVKLETSTSEADMGKKKTVSLMTIHASKGLEFENVFVVGLESGIFPHARSVVGIDFSGRPSKEDLAPLEEERRMAYVALTRAKSHIELSRAKWRYDHNSKKEFKTQESMFINEDLDAFVKRQETPEQQRNRGNWNNQPGKYPQTAKPKQNQSQTVSTSDKIVPSQPIIDKTPIPDSVKPTGGLRDRLLAKKRAP